MAKPARTDDLFSSPKIVLRKPFLKFGDQATAMRGWKLFLSQR
jgi:hypothetical protein